METGNWKKMSRFIPKLKDHQQEERISRACDSLGRALKSIFGLNERVYSAATDNLQNDYLIQLRMDNILQQICVITSELRIAFWKVSKLFRRNQDSKLDLIKVGFTFENRPIIEFQEMDRIWYWCTRKAVNCNFVKLFSVKCLFNHFLIIQKRLSWWCSKSWCLRATQSFCCYECLVCLCELNGGSASVYV